LNKKVAFGLPSGVPFGLFQCSTSREQSEMALSITVGKGFEFNITGSSIFAGIDGLFAFFASFGPPTGARRWECSRLETGHGVRLFLGPLWIEASRDKQTLTSELMLWK